MKLTLVQLEAIAGRETCGLDVVACCGGCEHAVDAAETALEAWADAEEARSIVRDLFPQEQGQGLRRMILDLIDENDSLRLDAKARLDGETGEGPGKAAFHAYETTYDTAGHSLASLRHLGILDVRKLR